MKVRWLIRPKAKPGISIEQSFEALRPFFSEALTIEICFLPGTGSLKKDMLLQRTFIQHLPAVDLTHVLGDVHYTAAWIKGKQVHTYHDIDSLMEGKKLSQWIKQYYWVKHPLKKADGISCVSAYTQQQILALASSQKQKVRVIHNALAPNFESNYLMGETSRQARSDRNAKGGSNFFTVLSVGTKANKNLLRCAAALSGIEDVEWHIVGKISSTLQEQIAANKLNVVNHYKLDESALRALYNKADVLLFPSLYEGFGLPIIEAQASGTAIITANTTSMPEVAGEGALFVNPLSMEEIRAAILSSKADKPLRANQIKLGLENVKRFQIQTIAKQYEQWYISIVDGV